MKPHSIGAINLLSPEEKKGIYYRVVPSALREVFGLRPDLRDASGRPLARLQASAGSTDVVLDVRHALGAQDPTLYAHLTDTINGQIRVLLYVINDPRSPRYDVDRMPDGTPTVFGTSLRNIEAEEAALGDGLAPGQIRRRLGILRESVTTFEEFVASLGHEVFFIDPLFYHNAIIFEGYGFGYESGRRLMEEIDRGFSPGGDLDLNLDPGNPFRAPEAGLSVRGRSWSSQDGILGVAYSGVTMYRHLGQDAALRTAAVTTW